MGFTNPFFSVAGQVERLQNVGAVLAIAAYPFSADKVAVNIDNQPLKSAVSFVANNPYSTAAVATTLASPAALNSIGKAVTSLPIKTQVIAGSAALIGTAFVSTNQPAQIAVSKTLPLLTPEQLTKSAANLGRITNPGAQTSFSDVKDYVSSNPTLAVASIVGGALTFGSIGAGLNYLATKENTNAVKKNTDATIGSASSSLPASDASSVSPAAASPSDLSTAKVDPTLMGTPIPVASTPAPLIATGNGGTISNRKHNKGLFPRGVYGYVVQRTVSTTYKKEAKIPYSIYPSHSRKAQRYQSQKDSLYQERAALRYTA
jgi:hypothetical protein